MSSCARVEPPLGQSPFATQHGALIRVLAELLFKLVDQSISLGLNFILPHEQIATLRITQLFHLGGVVGCPDPTTACVSC